MALYVQDLMLDQKVLILDCKDSCIVFVLMITIDYDGIRENEIVQGNSVLYHCT